jgi:hypothetical protein
MGTALATFSVLSMARMMHTAEQQQQQMLSTITSIENQAISSANVGGIENQALSSANVGGGAY